VIAYQDDDDIKITVNDELSRKQLQPVLRYYPITCLHHENHQPKHPSAWDEISIHDTQTMKHEC
jgi:hypothetical protein